MDEVGVAGDLDLEASVRQRSSGGGKGEGDEPVALWGSFRWCCRS